MPNVKEFFDKLSDVQRDVFVSVVTDLQASSPQEKVKRLTEFHNRLKAEIDQINNRREVLGGVLNTLESLLKYLAEYIRKNGDNFELTLFRNNLQKFAADLRVEIANLRPEKKLAKKFDVARKIESLVQRQTMSGHLITEILGGSKVPAKPSDAALANIAGEECEEEEG
jgi:hypothetical protein